MLDTSLNLPATQLTLEIRNEGAARLADRLFPQPFTQPSATLHNRQLFLRPFCRENIVGNSGTVHSVSSVQVGIPLTPSFRPVNELIQSSSINLSFYFTGALQITSCDVNDQGKYECVANNSVGTEYSKSAMLYVKGTYGRTTATHVRRLLEEVSGKRRPYRRRAL